LNLRPPGYESCVAGAANAYLATFRDPRSSQVIRDQLRWAKVRAKLSPSRMRLHCSKPRKGRTSASVHVPSSFQSALILTNTVWAVGGDDYSPHLGEPGSSVVLRRSCPWPRRPDRAPRIARSRPPTRPMCWLSPASRRRIEGEPEARKPLSGGFRFGLSVGHRTLGVSDLEQAHLAEVDVCERMADERVEARLVDLHV
jgi:hypothetical protein